MSKESCRPLVSAVIPTRNRPDMVLRAVQSVLNQSVGELEVVVVIDGPDSDTYEALKRVQDHRVRVVALDESVGGSDARNIGVQRAQGAWIGLLDDDDEWLPEKCAQQIACAEQQSCSSSLIVSSFIARSSREGDRVQPQRLPRSGEAMSEYMFSPRCGFQTSTFFCQRELLLRVPFASGLKGCQDLDWFLRVTAEPDVQVLICEQPLVIFHVPESRQSVSRGLDWRFRLEWGRTRRHLMTPRAYSLFIVQVCATKAIERPFSFRTVWTLLFECVVRGSSSWRIVGHLLAIFCMSAETRQRIGSLIFTTAVPGACKQLVGPPAQQRNGA